MLPDSVFQAAIRAAAGKTNLICPTIDQRAIPPIYDLDGISQIIIPVTGCSTRAYDGSDGSDGGDEEYTCALATFCEKEKI